MRSIKTVVIIIFSIGCVVIWNVKSGLVHSQTGAPLSAPTRLTATDNLYNNKVGLNWDTMRGATAYRVFRSASNDPSAAIDIGVTPVNFFFDQTVAPGQTFFYWVRAENGATASALSSVDSGSRTGTLQQGPIAPLGPPPAGPPGNPVTAAKATLGKILFWDEQMSSTRTVSCGTCHHSGFGGTDPRSALSPASSTNPGPDALFNTPDDIRGSAGVPVNNVDGTYTFGQGFGLNAQVTARKSISYINAGYAPVLFWDGRATGTFRDPLTNAVVLNAGAALESQSVGPPVSSAEMAHAGRSWNDVAARIAESKPLALSPSIPTALDVWIGGRTYPELFLEAFGTADVTPARISMAIASFERTLFSDQAPVDQANAGITPLTAAEQRGRNIFTAQGCGTCHAGALMTDNNFHYLGLRPDTEDIGREAVTGMPNDRGAFRTPGLRNLELRRSYFHNGRFSTIEEVVDFYNRGGDFDANNKPNIIRPLGLNPNQRADLAAFLRRPLTDPRVTAESGPFERPQLYTESSRVPRITGTGRAGSGGFLPTIKAISPPLAGNPTFTISVDSAVGNADAVLVIDSTDPGVGTSIPGGGAFGRVETRTQNTGAGTGWASVSIPVPSTSNFVGRTFFARWYIADAGSVNGFAVSQAAEFTVFGDAVAVSNATISGQVMTPDGRGIRNTVVSVIDASGNRRTGTTSTFGFFTIEDIPTGVAYTVSVSSRRYRFTPQTVFLSENVSGLQFFGQE